jgi:purine-binding chemotaxis protein CheW
MSLPWTHRISSASEEVAVNQLTTHAGSGQAAVSVDEEANQYLTFFASGDRYAIDILDVNEIIEVGQMTRVPMTPDYIRGVINLRGSVVPVVDLCARLGKGRGELTKRSAIVLVEMASQGERQVLGMLVDEVNEILEIDAAHLQPPPDFGTDIRTDFIRAMGRVDELFMILLDINHVLSAEELSQLQKVAADGVGAAGEDMAGS